MNSAGDLFSNITPEVAEHKLLPTVAIGIGQQFVRAGEVYLLAECGPHTVILVSTSRGKRWDNPVSVKNKEQLSEQEIKEVFGGGSLPIKWALVTT